jgi:acyl-CoA thioester hydrolase
LRRGALRGKECPVSLSAPIPLHEESVRPEWIDRNGHMNLAYYIVIFDHATDALFEVLGIGEAYTQITNNSLFVVETHTLYERELREGERVQVRSLVLSADAKRLHFAHEMLSEAGRDRAAMQELMALHVDMSARRAVPFRADRQNAIAEVAAAHANLSRPGGLGRRIGLPG